MVTLYDIDTDAGPGLVAVLKAPAAPVQSFRITKPGADTALFASPEGWRPRPFDLPPDTEIAPGAGRIALLIPAEINMHLEPGAPVSLVLQLQDGQSLRHDLPIAFAHPLWSDETAQEPASPKVDPSPDTSATGAQPGDQHDPPAATNPKTDQAPSLSKPDDQSASDQGRGPKVAVGAAAPPSPTSPDMDTGETPGPEDTITPERTSRPILPWLLAASALLALLLGFALWGRDNGAPVASDADAPEETTQPPEVAEGPVPETDDGPESRSGVAIAPVGPRITDAEACRRQSYPERPLPDGGNPPIACDDSVFLQASDGKSHVIRPLANDLDDAGAAGLVLQDCSFPDRGPALAITGSRSITLTDDDPLRSLPLALRFSCTIRDPDGLTDRALLRLILEPRESSGIAPGDDAAPLQREAGRAEIVYKSDGLLHALPPNPGATARSIARTLPGALAHLERRAPDDLRITFASGLQLRMFETGEPHVVALPPDAGGLLRPDDILRDAGRAPEHFQTAERLLAHLRAAWEQPSVRLRLFRDGRYLPADLPLSLFRP